MKNLLFFCMFLSVSLYSEIKKISVIIPCHYKDSNYLGELIAAYEGQSLVPDELVISLSEAHLADSAYLDSIEARDWSFDLILLKTGDKRYAGENRNIACENASGDLIICQDADDLPHPQRVEIIKWAFDRYQCEHLIHSYHLPFEKEADYPQSCFSSFPVLAFLTFTGIENLLVHHGQCAFLKPLFEKVRWTAHQTGQDRIFSRNVYKVLPRKKKIVLLADLLCYHVERTFSGNSIDDFYERYLRKKTWQQGVYPSPF